MRNQSFERRNPLFFFSRIRDKTIREVTKVENKPVIVEVGVWRDISDEIRKEIFEEVQRGVDGPVRDILTRMF